MQVSCAFWEPFTWCQGYIRSQCHNQGWHHSQIIPNDLTMSSNCFDFFWEPDYDMDNIYLQALSTANHIMHDNQINFHYAIIIININISIKTKWGVILINVPNNIRYIHFYTDNSQQCFEEIIRQKWNK